MKFEEIKSAAEIEWKNFINPTKPRILIGASTCGRAVGAIDVIEAFKEELSKNGIDAIIFEVGCLGLCYLEPLVDITLPGGVQVFYRNVTPELVRRLVEEHIQRGEPVKEFVLAEGREKLYEIPVLKHQVRILLRNCGHIDPGNILHYIANCGYEGLFKALKMSPEEVIEEVKRSGLRGRGGTGFPTGLKWNFCRKSSGEEKYLICNADEGNPGAFMDRSILESDPHSVLEGMIIAGYAVGAKKGYIYVRAEYPLAVRRLEVAIAQAKEKGFLGRNILGSDFSFEIEIFQGAGAFVCGEETALIASIEGRRGMPTYRPPFPAQSGLWGKPTLINNVKTYAYVPQIIIRGADWFASIGSEKSKGTAVFALTGKVANCGLIEVPMGITLREIIYEIGGGISGGKAFKAVQIGGPSGGCLPENLLDNPVDYESLTAAGAMMGPGGIIVMDEDTCMVDIARHFLDFTQKESCGKCVPCRVGTKQMLDILEGIIQGNGKPEDIELLAEIGKFVKSGSLCGLGQTAPNPVLTTIRYFRDEYEAHVNEKRCLAKVCRALISYRILPEKCKGCQICLKSCPADAIIGERSKVHVIDQSRCIKCGVCFESCPEKFSAVECIPGQLPKEDE